MSDHSTTDAGKIADGLRAGPTFITNDATILDWPEKADGEYRVLRKGTNEWTCLPGSLHYSHDAAVHHATGVRVQELPVKIENLLA